MANTRRSYTAEFKEEAVRLAEQRGVAATSRDLGVDRSLIQGWKRQLANGGQKPFPGKGNARDEELATLKRTLRRLEEENAILKKAMGIFASRPQ